MSNILIEREEKIKLFINIGWTADIDKGIIYNSKGNVGGCMDCEGYIQMSSEFNGVKIYIKAHQFIYYLKTGEVVDCIDHINGVKHDNTGCNLRSITKQQNTFNTKAKGYTYVKSRNRWCAKINTNGVRKQLGYFKTEEEARNAYLQAKEVYHKI